MTTPQMLLDLVRLMLALATPAALLCLTLAGIALRREGGTNFWIGGGFSRWMFWAVVFFTLPQLLSWFPSFGVSTSVPSGAIGMGWMSSFANDATTFVTNFVVNRLAVVIAAFFVLRAVLDVADGGNPLASIVTSMFLLSIATTAALLKGWNSSGPYATTDVLAGAWTYIVSRIMPAAAALAVVGAIWNFWQNRPWMRLMGCAAAFLTVAALWRLVTQMVA